MAELYFLGNSTNGQMFGCVIKTENKTLVIDGGTKGDYPYLADFLKEKSGGVVDAWFFTHPHQDHIGAFLGIIENRPEIKTDKIFCNFPPIEMLKKYGGRVEFEILMWQEMKELFDTRFKDSLHTVKEGEVFEFDHIKINVLRVFNEKITQNFVNNSSAVYRIDSKDKRVLLLGDLGVEGGEEVMEKIDSESLYADYIQLSHHGQGGVSFEFYKYVKPKVCFWPTPHWLWDNDNGNGFDTGPWKTVETRRWMELLGAKEHIVAKDGTAKILI